MRLPNKPSTLIVGGLLAMSLPLFAAQQNSSSSSSSSKSAQESNSAAAHPSKSATSANERAANLINTINQDEIASAKTIQGKTQNNQVKDFTNTILNDHQDSQSKLQSIADQASINLKTQPSLHKQDQKMDQRLQKESSTQADKSYVQAEVRDHRTAIRQLQRLEPQITNSELKQFVQAQIPVLQKHLTDAQKLEAQLGVGGSASATPSHKANGSNGNNGNSNHY